MNNNTDPGCGRALNLDMAFSNSPSLDDTMAPGDSGDHSGQHGRSAAQPMDANMIPGSVLDPGHPCGL